MHIHVAIDNVHSNALGEICWGPSTPMSPSLPGIVLPPPVCIVAGQGVVVDLVGSGGWSVWVWSLLDMILMCGWLCSVVDGRMQGGWLL